MPNRKFYTKMKGDYSEIIRIKTITISIFFVFIFTNTNAQRVSIKEQKINIKELFGKIEEQTGYTASYNNTLIKDRELINIKIENYTLNNALKEILKDTEYTFKIVGRHFIIIPKEGYKVDKTKKTDKNKEIVATETHTTKEKKELPKKEIVIIDPLATKRIPHTDMSKLLLLSLNDIDVHKHYENTYIIQKLDVEIIKTITIEYMKSEEIIFTCIDEDTLKARKSIFIPDHNNLAPNIKILNSDMDNSRK